MHLSSPMPHAFGYRHIYSNALLPSAVTYTYNLIHSTWPYSGDPIPTFAGPYPHRKGVPRWPLSKFGTGSAHGWPKCGAGLGPYHLVPGSGRHDLGTGALGLYPTQTKQGKVKQRLPWNHCCRPTSKQAGLKLVNFLKETSMLGGGGRSAILEFLFFLWVSFLLSVNFSEAAWSTVKDSLSLGVVQWQHCAWYKEQGLWLLMRLSCTTWLLLLLGFLFKQKASSRWIRPRFCSPGLFPTLSHRFLCSPFDKIFPTPRKP
jgi:hypothetical protein